MGRYIWYADWFLAPAARLSHHSAIKMIIFVIQTIPSWCLVVHTHFYAKSRPCGQVNMPGCLRRHITWCYYYLKCEIVIVWLFDCLTDQSIHTFTCSDDIWPRTQTDRQTMPRIDTNLSLKLTEFKWYCIPLPAELGSRYERELTGKLENLETEWIILRPSLLIRTNGCYGSWRDD